jgi:quercetin dioxygenase-like cupin family protein
MQNNRTSERTFLPTGHPGVERALFRNHEGGGRSSAVRMEAGARFPRHRHQASEEVLVLSGRVRIDGVELDAGDWLYSEPGSEHDVVALTDAVIFVSSQQPTTLLE